MKTADTPQLHLEEEFTLQAWVRPEEFLGSAAIISKELENEKGQSSSLGIGLTEYGRIQGYAVGQCIHSREAFEEGHWIHVAFTYDGDQEADLRGRRAGREQGSGGTRNGQLRSGNQTGHSSVPGASSGADAADV